METYGRIGLLRSYGNLQSYWTTTKLWKLTVVLDYYEAIETYSRKNVYPEGYYKVPPYQSTQPKFPLQRSDESRRWQPQMEKDKRHQNTLQRINTKD